MDINWIPKRTAKGIYEFVHVKTGLKLLLVPKNGLPVTTANITYHVGSRNEGLGVRGATHYLEHGMFKGSKNFNKNTKAGGMWKLEAYGAILNATTYMDRTNYFSVIDSKWLQEVVEREADRMFYVCLNEEDIKSEMTVVRNEMERGNNNDFEVLQKRIMAAAFIAHPYHHSTIGLRSEVEGTTAKALKAFHDEFYKPSNATYTFVGNFDVEKVKQMVHTEFSKGPGGNQSVPNMYTTEPAQMGQRRLIVRKPSNSALMCIAFKAPNGLHHDAIVLKVIANLISDGPQALAIQFKKDRDIPVHDIIAEFERMRDPYLFSIWGTTSMPTESALQKTENVIHTITEIVKTMSDPVALKRAKKSLHNEWENEMVGTKNTAMALNEAIALGDPFDVHRRFEVLDSVSMEDITRVAKDIFNVDRSTVGWLLPGENASEIVRSDYDKYNTKTFETVPTMSGGFELTVSDSELTKNENSHKADIRLSIQSTATTGLKSYVNNTILSQLMTRGFKINSRTCAENELSAYLSDKNIQRHISPSVDCLHIQASIPAGASTLVHASNLLLHELSNPLLQKPSFEYLKEKWMAELHGSKDDVNHLAKVGFFQTLFKREDPNYRYSAMDIITQLQQTSHSDIIDAHAQLKKGPRIVTIVAPDNIHTLKNNGTWDRNYHNYKMAVARSNDIKLKGKSSVAVKYGMVVDGSDALRLAVAVLGGGFTGKLMQEVRDKRGLTYGISASMQKLKGCEVFVISATFSPLLLQKGIEATEEVIKKWLAEPITERECQIQKDETLGATNVQYDAPGALASAIQQTKIEHGSVDYINEYKNTIESITCEQLNDSKKAIKFESLARLRVGTF